MEIHVMAMDAPIFVWFRMGTPALGNFKMVQFVKKQFYLQ